VTPFLWDLLKFNSFFADVNRSKVLFLNFYVALGSFFPGLLESIPGSFYNHWEKNGKNVDIMS